MLFRGRFGRRPFRRLVLLVALILLIDALGIIASLPPTPVPHETIRDRPRTVFIASIHLDTAPLLHRSWSSAVLELAELLGPENVYVSLVEVGSSDGTRLQLAQLRRKLDARGISSTAAWGPLGWELAQKAAKPPGSLDTSGPGWAWRAGKSKPDLLVTPVLAGARNLALEPLSRLREEGRAFESVLWVEDVEFRPRDAMRLLDTHDGEYAAACSVNVSPYARLYDTSALRDIAGRAPTSSFWPWFSSSVVSPPDAISVYSCWDGLVALDAAPFYEGLAFRAVDDRLADQHIEASERCLLHADNPLSASRGVFLNTGVRTTRWGSIGQGHFPGWLSAVMGTWVSRINRWSEEERVAQQQDVVLSGVRAWAAERGEQGQDRKEAATACLAEGLRVVRPRGWQTI